MHDEVTKSIVHTIWLNNLFSDRIINSLQVDWQTNYQTTEKDMTYKYLGLDHEDTPGTKFDHLLNSSSGKKYKFDKR